MKNTARLAAAAALVLLAAAPLAKRARADEGMWTFDNLPVKQMQQKYQFVPDKAWLDHAQHSTLQLPGCTGSFVSGDGLVMTNHHCVEDCLQAIGTDAKKDYMADGFTAKSRVDEVRCPAFEVSELLSTTDVTAKMAEATKGVADVKFNDAQNAQVAKLESACVGKEKDTVHCRVVDLYHGGQYVLFRYKRFKDVRMVFTPESSSASFGGDPDNFNFPRFALDVAFLRLYEGGKPFKSPEHFAWNATGAKAGDEVFVTGHPGGTDRLLTVAELEYARDVRYPKELDVLAQYRGMLHEYAREGATQKQLAEAELNGIENEVKVARGEFEALLDRTTLERRRVEENAVRAAVAADPGLSKDIGDPWALMATAVARERQLGQRHELIGEGGAFASRLFRIARTVVRGAAERTKPDGERLPEFSDSKLPGVEVRLFSRAPIFTELEERQLAMSLYRMREMLGPDDAIVKKVLGKSSPESLAHLLVSGTTLADPAARKALWDGGAKAVDASADPMVVLARAIDADSRAIRKTFEDEVEAPATKASEKVARGYFAVHGRDTYPDATFTLRLSYGSVKGWKRADGVDITPFTTMGGAFDRATGEDPFALPASWIGAKSKIALDTQFNFVTDNDITGGNSGSPMLDKSGHIVGVAFDGNIESIGGNYWFDDSVNRCVGVSSPAILEALRSVYKNDALARELTGGAGAPAGGAVTKTRK